MKTNSANSGKVFRSYFAFGALVLSSISFSSIDLLGQTTETATKRELIRNTVPAHLPIRVEILYDNRVELLENARIKVTNTGKRPIFYFDLLLGTSGLPIEYNVSWLQYGRKELRSFQTRAQSDDPFLGRDASFVFVLDKEWIRKFLLARQAQGMFPTRYELIIQVLHYGDGTGFWTTGGVPFSDKHQDPPVNATDRPQPVDIRDRPIFEN